MSRLTIKRWLFLIVLVPGVVLLAGQLIFQSYFINYVSGIHRAGAEMVMDRVTAEINETFVDMAQAVNTIAESYYVLDYARTSVTGQRYEKAFEQVRPIVQGATQGMDFDHLLVSDITSSWFRFDIGSGSGNLSVAAGRQIMGRLKRSRPIPLKLPTPLWNWTAPLISVRCGRCSSPAPLTRSRWKKLGWWWR